MTIEKIVNYVLHTPHNTNKAILIAMLEDLIKTSGGIIEPDKPIEKFYDGGNESNSGGDINTDGVIDLIYDSGMET